MTALQYVRFLKKLTLKTETDPADTRSVPCISS